MIFDFVDRQVIVSMFPFLKAEWNLSDKELDCWFLSSPSPSPRSASRSPDCRSAQPRQKHRSDGVDLEPGVHRLHVHAELRAIACGARRHRSGRSWLRCRRAAMVATHFPTKDARRLAAALLPPLPSALSSSDPRRLYRLSLGLEGGLRYRRLSRSHSWRCSICSSETIRPLQSRPELKPGS